MFPNELIDSLKPETIERLRQLELFSRLRVEGMLSGENRSTLLGLSTDFVSHRPYFPGDDIRRIDWRVFARSERLTVKQFEDQRNLTTAVALDVSGSMAYGDGDLTKHEYAVRCAALILYLMHLQHDAFALYLFNDHLAQAVPAGSSRRHLLGVFAALAAAQPEGETAFETPLRQIEAHFSRRGLLVLISDCMGDPQALARTLARFRMRGTDVIVLQITHPAERDFPFTQVSRFTCLETEVVDSVDPLEIRNLYRREFARHTHDLKAALLQRDMDHCELPVDGNYERALGDYLRRRMEILT